LNTKPRWLEPETAARTSLQAAELHISVCTAGSHLDRIRNETGCRRRADLPCLARRAGLV
jgi:DNA-binding CsgD family transcriptional regulator